MYDLARDHVVVPLLGLAIRVRADVEAQGEAVDGQAATVAQAQVGEIHDQLAVDPRGDATVVLARSGSP